MDAGVGTSLWEELDARCGELVDLVEPLGRGSASERTAEIVLDLLPKTENIIKYHRLEE